MTKLTSMFPYQNTIYSLDISQPAFAPHHKLVTQTPQLYRKLLPQLKKRKKSHTLDQNPPRQKQAALGKALPGTQQPDRT